MPCGAQRAPRPNKLDIRRGELEKRLLERDAQLKELVADSERAHGAEKRLRELSEKEDLNAELAIQVARETKIVDELRATRANLASGKEAATKELGAKRAEVERSRQNRRSELEKRVSQLDDRTRELVAERDRANEARRSLDELADKETVDTELTRQIVVETEAVDDLRAGHANLDSRKEEAREALRAKRAEVEQARQDRRAELEKRLLQLDARTKELVAERKRVGEARGLIGELAKRESRRASLETEVASAAKAVDELQAERAGLETQKEEAAEALRRAISPEAERARQAYRSELERKSLELDARAKEIAAERERAGEARQLLDRLANAEAELARHECEKRGAEGRAAAASEALDEAEAANALLEVAGLVAKERRARAELAELESVLDDVRGNRARAAEQRQRAGDLQVRLVGGLPEAAELDDMRQLARELEVAEASLGGGLAVVIERLEPVAVAAMADGVDLEVIARGRVEIDADRALELQLGQFARISVTAGAPEARRRAAELRARWTAEVVPILERLGCGIDELAARFDANRTVHKHIDEALALASNLEERAADREAQLGGLDRLQTQLAALGRDLESKAREAATTLLDEIGEGALDVRQEELRQRQASLTAARDDALSRATLAESDRRVLKERVELLRARRGELEVRKPELGWDAYEVELARRIDSAATEKQRITAELESFVVEEDVEAGDAEAALAAVDRALAEVAAKLEGARRRFEGAQRMANHLDGELDARRAQVVQLEVSEPESGWDVYEADLVRRIESVTNEQQGITVELENQGAEKADASLGDAEVALATVDSALVELAAKLEGAERRLEESQRRASHLRGEIDARRAHVAQLGVAEPTSGWDAYLAELAKRLESVANEKQQISDELGSLAAGKDVELRDAESTVATFDSKLAELATKLDGANRRLEETQRRANHLGGELDALRAQVVQLEISEPDSGWDAFNAGLRQRIDSVVGDKQRIARELERLAAETDSEVSDAEAALAGAGAELAACAAELEAAGRRLEDTRREADQLAGKLEVSRAHVAQLDLEARHSEVAAVAARLAQLPAPDRPVSAADLDAAEAAVRQAAADHGTARDDLRKAEGALQTVGGQVVREQEQAAREALRIAERRERDVEIEYDAWKLVVDKLREAENTEGQHLGEALSRPVTERFAELTAHRYGKLAVGPDLAARGLVVSGTPRDLASFSAGTQEQLATLLRLTIAEHLGTALILDDHLVQTDPARSAHFRDLLRQHAARAQVIVLTCRPLDYLLDSDLPATGDPAVNRAAGLIRAIDLAAVIERTHAEPAPAPADEQAG